MAEWLTKLFVYTLLIVSNIVWALVFHRWMDLPKLFSILLAIIPGLITMLATGAFVNFMVQVLASLSARSRYRKAIGMVGISIDQVLASSLAPTLLVDDLCGSQFGIGHPVVWCFHDIPSEIGDDYEWDFSNARLVDLPRECRSREYLANAYPQLRVLETRGIADGQPFVD